MCKEDTTSSIREIDFRALPIFSPRRKRPCVVDPSTPVLESWWLVTPVSQVLEIPVRESSHQCVAPAMLYPNHVFSNAVNCESDVHLRVFRNGHPEFGNKGQDVVECLLVKSSGRQGTQDTEFQEGCWRRGGRTVQAPNHLAKPSSSTTWHDAWTLHRTLMTVLVFRTRFGLILVSICTDSSDGFFCQDLQRLRWDRRALLARLDQRRQRLQDTRECGCCNFGRTIPAGIGTLDRRRLWWLLYRTTVVGIGTPTERFADINRTEDNLP